MNYVEYGKENSNVIILLHGGGLSWWNYKEVAEDVYKRQQHCLLCGGHPVSGHSHPHVKGTVFFHGARLKGNFIFTSDQCEL